MKSRVKQEKERVVVFNESGMPLKPIVLTPARDCCKRCGAKIRWAKDATVGIRLAVDEDLYIVRPVEGFNGRGRRYITMQGDVICGEPLPRGAKGCYLTYRLHDCNDRDNESRADIRKI